MQTPLVRRIDRVAYRDALIMLLLSAAPVRLRNLAMIDIGTHLHRSQQRATLRFAENETKNRQRLTHPLPRHVLPYLHLYLDRDPAELCACRGLRPPLARVRGRTADRAFDLRPDHSRHRSGCSASRSTRTASAPAPPPASPTAPPTMPASRLRCSATATSPRPSGTTSAPSRSRPAARSCYARRHPSQPRSKGIAMTAPPSTPATPPTSQRDASIEDQVRLCRELRRARRLGSRRRLFDDRAISGASTLRPGLPAPARGGAGGRVRRRARRGARPAQPRPGGHRGALQAAALSRRPARHRSARARSAICTSASRAR